MTQFIKCDFLHLKPVRVGDNLTDKGRLFQTMVPETEKALFPNLVLVHGKV